MEKSNRKLKPKTALLIYIGIILSCVIVFLGLLYFPRLQLFIGRQLWDANKPTSYSMQVRKATPQGGSVRWKIRVENGKVVEAIVLDGHKAFLDPEKLTIEQLFSLADSSSCAGRGFLDCGIRFDMQYFYPKQIDSYETFFIEIEHFTIEPQ